MSQAQTILKSERPRSREIFERAEKVLVGGVNSPVRAFRSVGGEPLIIERASGQYLYDADGDELLDYVCSWGAIILGHANAAIAEAIADQARRGTSFGVTTELELELATLITQAIPFLEKIRFVSSGTEATMSAVRLARGVTKRNFIVKFEGCYHGHADSFLSQAGSGLATLGIAECPGVPQALAELTLNVPFNDLQAVEKVFSMHKDKIAAVIVEPIAANMGVVPPEERFLKGLEEITHRNGALLIVDEVITGFRLRNGSAQEMLGVYGDLTTLGLYEGMTQLAQRLVSGLRTELSAAGISAQVNAIGSLATVFFTPGSVRNYADAKSSNTKHYAQFFREMLARGIFLAPSQFEAAFLTAAHTSADIDRTLAAAGEALQSIAAQPAA